jgi:hypothetical protein
MAGRGKIMFKLGRFEYPSKRTLFASLKQYLECIRPGIITHPVTIEKLHNLVSLHPEADRKRGCGISHFLVARNVMGSGKSFQIVRTDGSVERFSYKACLEGAIPTKRAKAFEAFRFAVRAQMREFRLSVSLPATCYLTGEPLLRQEDLYLDHIVPFWSLVEEFCTLHGVDISELETIGNGEQLRLLDHGLTTDFQAFHRQHADLKPTSRKAYAEKGGRLSEKDMDR